MNNEQQQGIPEKEIEETKEGMSEEQKQEISIGVRVKKITDEIKANVDGIMDGIKININKTARRIKRWTIIILCILCLLVLSGSTFIGYIYYFDRQEFKQVLKDSQLTRAIVQSVATIHEEKLVLVQVIDEEARSLVDGKETLTPHQKVAIAETIQESIQRYSKECPVLTSSFIFGIIKQESWWDPEIISWKFDEETGKAYPVAYGLMQIRWSTAVMCADLMREKGIDDIKLEKPEDLFDPVKNIKIGIFYYWYLYKIYKDKKYALHAYYAGEYWTNKSKEKAKVITWGFGHCDIVEGYQKMYQERGVI